MLRNKKKPQRGNGSVRTGGTKTALCRIVSQIINKMHVTENDRTRLGGFFLIGE